MSSCKNCLEIISELKSILNVSDYLDGHEILVTIEEIVRDYNPNELDKEAKE